MKLVFAHYMLCFTGWTRLPPAPQADWVATCLDEIEVAYNNQLDGFSLEFGMAEYTPQLDAMFAACEVFNRQQAPGARPFRLIPMVDGINFTHTTELLLRHANSSCQMTIDDRPVLSSWNPVNLRGNASAREHAAAEWEQGFFQPLIARGFPRPIFWPFLFAPSSATPNPAAPTLADQRALLRDFGSALDGLWYWGCAALGDAVANSSAATVAACREAGKLSAVPVSAPYSPHRLEPPEQRQIHNSYWPGAGARGICDSWMAAIKSQPDMVIYSTWNDLSEHHYLGPYDFTNWGRSAVDWYLDPTSTFPHTGYLELSAYFARWYKLPAGSSAPAVTPKDEAVFYFYNLQPVHNPCPGDPRRPTNPVLNTTFVTDARYPAEDALYATVLLSRPANITLTTGLPYHGKNFDINPTVPPQSTAFALGAGLHSVQVASLPGGQRIEVSRAWNDASGNEQQFARSVVGTEGINTTEMSSALCNYQTFSGVLRFVGP